MKSAARVTLVTVAGGFGALFAIGSIVAVRVEASGFTSASADGARPGYVFLLGLGLVASVAVPFTIASWAFPDLRSTLLVVAGITIAVGIGLFVAAAL